MYKKRLTCDLPAFDYKVFKVKKTYPECVNFTCDSCNKNYWIDDAVEVESSNKIYKIERGIKSVIQKRLYSGTCIYCSEAKY